MLYNFFILEVVLLLNKLVSYIKYYITLIEDYANATSLGITILHIGTLLSVWVRKKLSGNKTFLDELFTGTAFFFSTHYLSMFDRFAYLKNIRL